MDKILDRLDAFFPSLPHGADPQERLDEIIRYLREEKEMLQAMEETDGKTT